MIEIQPSLFETPEYHCIAGCDEAGRGPLAGPVCASCVVLSQDFPSEILDDSKKLSEKKRYIAEEIIKQKAVAWAVAWSSPGEIDEINILQASLLAMKRAYEAVEKKLKDMCMSVDILYVDGNKRPDVNVNCEAVIKGDSLIPEIMAASILAKNARDRFMLCADKRWPQYNFKQHKGYPTKQHIEAIVKYGLSPIHRKTFSFHH